MIEMLPRLRAFARSLTRDQTQADDLVQVTCEKALRNLAGFTPGTRLDSWLFRILRNAWIDEVRTRVPQETIEDSEAAGRLVSIDGPRRTEARLELAAVGRAMEALPEDQRSVLMLVCVEGLRYREAAAALGVPEGTVMSRLSRARVALAATLGMTGGVAGARKGGRR
nr:RNA polymerase sigma factor [Pararhodobacter sp. SW119]